MKSHKMMASYTNVFVSNTNVPPLMTFSFVLMHSVGFEIIVVQLSRQKSKLFIMN